MRVGSCESDDSAETTSPTGNASPNASSDGTIVRQVGRTLQVAGGEGGVGVGGAVEGAEELAEVTAVASTCPCLTESAETAERGGIVRVTAPPADAPHTNRCMAKEAGRLLSHKHPAPRRRCGRRANAGQSREAGPCNTWAS